MAGESTVQSVARTFAVIDAIADAGGQAGISAIAARTGLAESTAHRLASTLVSLGVLRRLPDRRYGLGTRLVRLGSAAAPATGALVRPVLQRLVDELGESANLAMLVADQAEYIAQVSSRHTMRLFTEVGRRVDLHCTGVGKAILSALTDEQITGIVDRAGLPPRTVHTITDRDRLTAELSAARERGHCLDEEEQELGVRCVAVPITATPDRVFAVSVSGPVQRMTDELIARAVPQLQAAAAEIAAVVGE